VSDDVMLATAPRRGVPGRILRGPLTMSSSEMSSGSGASVSSAASEWGEGDPGIGMTGVHLRVLGGRSVWPFAFHELMAAGDRREHVGWRLAGADFTPESLGPRTAGAYFLSRVLWGEAVDWVTCDVPPCEVDRVLAALGLYHVWVRCVIPEELGGQYERAVSISCCW
jgi:hypothetical protein